MADESQPVLIPCPTCKGAGKLSSDNKESWNQFKGLQYNSDEMEGVRTGRVVPIVCPDCKGTKVVEQKAEPSAPVKSTPISQD